MNFRIISFFSRAITYNFLNNKRNIHSTLSQSLKFTEKVNAEPPKPKKKMDPAIEKAREERRRRKIEKEIKKIERFGRNLKPIEEIKQEKSIINELQERKRKGVKLSENELYEFETFEIKWGKLKKKKFLEQGEQILALKTSQGEALKELKNDNIKLFDLATQLDDGLINFTHDGPSYTPKIKNYEAPDGDYYDVTYLYDKK